MPPKPRGEARAGTAASASSGERPQKHRLQERRKIHVPPVRPLRRGALTKRGLAVSSSFDDEEEEEGIVDRTRVGEAPRANVEVGESAASKEIGSSTMSTAASGSGGRKKQGKDKMVRSRSRNYQQTPGAVWQQPKSNNNTSCPMRAGQQLNKSNLARTTKHKVVSYVITSQDTGRMIQKLEELGLGEDMAYEEYLSYLSKLPDRPPPVDTSLTLDTAQIRDVFERHALYRIKAYKLSQGISKCDMEDDKWKEDYPPSILRENGYFLSFEKDGTLDWSFPIDYCYLAQLSDYQRLVPQNHCDAHGGRIYENWDEYCQFFHGYDIEQQYADYCAELSKQLKWLEDYVLVEQPLWGPICSRASNQALKIASRFSKISGDLASIGYSELVNSMTFDVSWCKELDGVHFEIWKRVAKQKKSFQDALDEVYKLNKFPLRQDRMKYALENDCSMLEKEFRACTVNITDEFPEDKAQELITVAVKELREKTKVV